ncbi:hypothetical protein BKA70DRAFT_796460 [Coprinopsis sp. MPI-PUGE-AT-0042]|nr:hypothetical protein BKA70DRAFT_796460 [Coprinopsis sp. MPI-PUGE-AT-0042]
MPPKSSYHRKPEPGPPDEVASSDEAEPGNNLNIQVQVDLAALLQLINLGGHVPRHIGARAADDEVLHPNITRRRSGARTAPSTPSRRSGGAQTAPNTPRRAERPNLGSPMPPTFSGARVHPASQIGSSGARNLVLQEPTVQERPEPPRSSPMLYWVYPEQAVTGKKYYVVVRGRACGVFANWIYVQDLIQGDSLKNIVAYQGCNSFDDAWTMYQDAKARNSVRLVGRGDCERDIYGPDGDCIQ